MPCPRASGRCNEGQALSLSPSVQGRMLPPIHQHTGYGYRVIAASLILTAYWSGRTAHSEFSQLKRRERSCCMDCCTVAKKGPCIPKSVTITLFYLFSLSLFRQDIFLYLLTSFTDEFSSGSNSSSLFVAPIYT